MVSWDTFALRGNKTFLVYLLTTGFLNVGAY